MAKDKLKINLVVGKEQNQKNIFIFLQTLNNIFFILQDLDKCSFAHKTNFLFVIDNKGTYNEIMTILSTNPELNKDKILSALQNKDVQFVNEYFENLSTHNFSENIITDKQLDNFRWIGLIKLFFPNSKIIICKRNYKANALSIYKNNISSVYYNWTNDPEDILSYIKHYDKFINLWKKLLTVF